MSIPSNLFKNLYLFLKPLFVCSLNEVPSTEIVTFFLFYSEAILFLTQKRTSAPLTFIAARMTLH